MFDAKEMVYGKRRFPPKSQKGLTIIHTDLKHLEIHPRTLRFLTVPPSNASVSPSSRASCCAVADSESALTASTRRSTEATRAASRAAPERRLVLQADAQG